MTVTVPDILTVAVPDTVTVAVPNTITITVPGQVGEAAAGGSQADQRCRCPASVPDPPQALIQERQKLRQH